MSGFIDTEIIEGDTSERDAQKDLFNQINWCGRALIDIFSMQDVWVDTGNNECVFYSNKLRVPPGASNSTSYEYHTLTMDMDLPGSTYLTLIMMNMQYDRPSGCAIKAEIDIGITGVFYTFLDIAANGTVNTNNLSQTIAINGGTGLEQNKTNLKVKITLTTNSSGEGPTVDYYSVFTDPAVI